jgi:phosphocarrier protein
LNDGPDAAAGQPNATQLLRMVTIVNRRGLHARAAAKFVTLAERFGASVDVLRDGQVVSARSIMGLMMLVDDRASGRGLGCEGGAGGAERAGRGRLQ